MKSIDREFSVVATLIGVAIIYGLVTMTSPLLVGAVALCGLCMFGVWRVGRAAGQRTRITAMLFLVLPFIIAIRNASAVVDGILSPLWMAAELLLTTGAAFWFVWKPGGIPAILMALLTFFGLISTVQSLMWMLDSEYPVSAQLIFNVTFALTVRFTVIALLLRGWADNFGKTLPPKQEVGGVFD
jgi:hypothetical protein